VGDDWSIGHDINVFEQQFHHFLRIRETNTSWFSPKKKLGITTTVWLNLVIKI
jgi:hypothetical protein